MNGVTTVVLPVKDEGEALVPHLEAVLGSVAEPREVLIVHDAPEDSTVQVASRYAHHGVRPVLNTYGGGSANAIRCGLDHASGDVAVVTTADGGDDASQINEMADLVRDGNAVVAASRYMPGGRQLGGSALRRLFSRTAGMSLYYLARVGTRDATNAFKAYSTDFVYNTEIESSDGLEIGIELVAKAHRRRLSVTEIPTTCRDAGDHESRFRPTEWVPRYLRWYVHAFGPMVRTAVPVHNWSTL